MGSHRIDRINGDAQKEIAEILRELKDPRIPEMTSVVSVHVTNDLHFAKVYVSILGTDEQIGQAMKALNSAAGFVRKELGKRMMLRITPQVSFELDESIAYGAHILKILYDLKKEDKKDD